MFRPGWLQRVAQSLMAVTGMAHFGPSWRLEAASSRRHCLQGQGSVVFLSPIRMLPLDISCLVGRNARILYKPAELIGDA